MSNSVTNDCSTVKIIFLGSGSAFCTGENYQSNILILRNGKGLLLDCGGDIRFSLQKAGYNLSYVDSVYISHLHADHIGGLEWVAFSKMFTPDTDKPNLFLAKELKDSLWQSLSGGLTCVEGKDDCTLESYFNVNDIEGKLFVGDKDTTKCFIWEDINFTVVPKNHVTGKNSTVVSYGLFIEVNGKRIYWTSDIQLSNPSRTPCQDKYYTSSDLIFHDCETSFKSGVHPHYDHLKNGDKTIKNKMWLYHYNPNPTQNPIVDGFKGFIQPGQTFVINRGEKILTST